MDPKPTKIDINVNEETRGWISGIVFLLIIGPALILGGMMFYSYKMDKAARVYGTHNSP